MTYREQTAKGGLGPRSGSAGTARPTRRSERSGLRRGVAVRRGPLSGPPVRADPSRPPGDARDAVRAATPRRRSAAACSSSAAATAGNLIPMALGAARVELRRDRRRARARSPAGRRSSAALGLDNVTLEARRDRGPRAGAGRLRLRDRPRRLLVGAGGRARSPARGLPRRARRARRGLRQLQRAARRARARGAARHARLPHRRARPTRASASRRRGRCCASCSRARRASTRSGRLMRGQAERLLARSDATPAPRRARRGQRRRLLPRVRRARRAPRAAVPRRGGLLRDADRRGLRAGRRRRCSRSRTRCAASSTSTSSRRGCSARRCCAAPSWRSTARRAPRCSSASPSSTQAQARGEPGADGAQAFEGPTGSTLTTDHPLVIDALRRAAERVARRARGCATCWGREARDAERTALCDALLRSYAANLVVLHVHPPRLTTTPGDAPRTSALARHQARGRRDGDQPAPRAGAHRGRPRPPPRHPARRHPRPRRAGRRAARLPRRARRPGPRRPGRRASTAASQGLARLALLEGP